MFRYLFLVIICILLNEPLKIKGDDREHPFMCDCPTSMTTTMNTLVEDLKNLKLWMTNEIATIKSGYQIEMKNLTDDNFQLNRELQMVSDKLSLTDKKIIAIEKNLESAKIDANKIKDEVEIEINNYTKEVQSYADKFQSKEKDLKNQILYINNTIMDRQKNFAYFKKILHFQGIQSIADEKSYQSLVYTWIIKNIEEKLGNSLYLLEEESEEFRVEAYSCSIRIKIEQTPKNVNLTLISKPKHCLKFPLITFILTEASNNGNQQREVVRSFSYSSEENLVNVNPYEDKSFMFTQIELKRLNSNITNRVKLEVHVEPLVRPNHALSRTGQLLWVIPNYIAKMERVGISFEMSPSFYTDHEGFRMQIIFRFNSKSQKLSAWVVFLRNLEWSVPKGGDFKFTLTVFNQEDNTNDLILTSRMNNKKPSTFFLVELVDYSRIKAIATGDNLFYKLSVERE